MNDNLGPVLFTISPATALIAIEQVTSCESCNPTAAKFPFTWVIDSLMGLHGAEANYFLTECIECPRCGVIVTESTLIEWGQSGEER